MTERMHFTRGNVLMHAEYTLLQGRVGAYWLKRPESEDVCACEERADDRRFLLGLVLVDNQRFIDGMMAQTPTYEVRG